MRSCSRFLCSVAASITEMMNQIPEYQARFEDGILVICPLKMGGGSPLDRVVPHFKLVEAGMVKAAEAVRRIFEPDYVLPFEPMTAPDTGDTDAAKRRRDEYNERFKPVITIDLANVTVETILTTIGKKCGGASWRVSYTTEERRCEDSVCTIIKESQ
jgi:hypothetical protein